MADIYSKQKPQLDSPGVGAFAVTPNDSTDLTQVPRWLYIGGAGNLAVVMANDDSVTFVSVPVGRFDIRVSRILATGTTATNIVAVY